MGSVSRDMVHRLDRWFIQKERKMYMTRKHISQYFLGLYQYSTLARRSNESRSVYHEIFIITSVLQLSYAFLFPSLKGRRLQDGPK